MFRNSINKNQIDVFLMQLSGLLRGRDRHRNVFHGITKVFLSCLSDDSFAVLQEPIYGLRKDKSLTLLQASLCSIKLSIFSFMSAVSFHSIPVLLKNLFCVTYDFTFFFLSRRTDVSSVRRPVLLFLFLLTSLVFYFHCSSRIISPISLV